MVCLQVIDVCCLTPQFKACESIPSKKQLLATIARLAKQPATKIATGIKQVPTKLAVAIKEVRHPSCILRIAASANNWREFDTCPLKWL